MKKESESVRFCGIETRKAAGRYAWFEINPDLLISHEIVTPHGEIFPGYRVNSNDLEKRRTALIEQGIKPDETDKAIYEANLDYRRRQIERAEKRGDYALIASGDFPAPKRDKVDIADRLARDPEAYHARGVPFEPGGG